jgi:hypothetical protein
MQPWQPPRMPSTIPQASTSTRGGSLPQREKDLQLSEVFECNDGCPQSKNRDEGQHSTDELVRRFSASVGSKSLHRSVAEFYLEMYSHNVDWAVTSFKEQQGVGKETQQEGLCDRFSSPLGSKSLHLPRNEDYHQYYGKVPASATAAPVPHRATPRRHNPQNNDMLTSPRPRIQPPRRHKSYDAAEAATVTAPCLYRSNHSRYHEPRRANGNRSPHMPRRSTIALASSDASQVAARTHGNPTVPRRCTIAVTSYDASRFDARTHGNPTVPRRCTIAVTSYDASRFDGYESRAAVPLVRSSSDRRVAGARGTVNTLYSPTYRNPQQSHSSRDSPLEVWTKQSSRDVRHYPNDGANITRPPTASSCRRTIPRRQETSFFQARYGASWEPEPPTRHAISSNPAA